MGLLDNLNAAIDYIESNLTGEIDYKTIERIAQCSRYQFMRMFSAALDMPVAEYIRRRRLTLAAMRLQQGARVVDTALESSYDSPDAFSRAFRAQHGISPSEARQSGARLTAYPRATLTFSIKGVEKMDYKIEQKPAFRVLGRRQRFSMKDEEQLQLIPKMWDWLTKERCARMLGVAAAPDIFGVCEMVGEDELDYWIAVASKAGGLEELESLEIPAATWAVFESVGPIPSAIQELERRIYGEWFSSSGYKRAPGPDIERYPPGDKESKGYYCEVWVPIEKE